MRKHYIIPIYNIPINVLDSIQEKWAKSLLNGRCDWTSCALCEYMEKKVGHECCSYCPLNVGERPFCTEEWLIPSRLYLSRLYRSSWEKDVSDFLYWIEIEKEKQT